jgi:hypothetical protein
MNKSAKLLLGAASVWPPIYMLLFMVVAVYSIFSRGSEPPAIWALIIPLHILTILLSIGLMIFYMVNVFRNDRVNKDMKVLWAVVLFMGAIIAMPIYWYLYIWRKVSSSPAPRRPETLGPGTISFEGTANSWAGRTNEDEPSRQAPDWR